MIGVIAGNYKQYLSWLVKMKVEEKEKVNYFFVAGVTSLLGRKIDRVEETGTYYERNDYHEIKHKLDHIRRYHNNYLVVNEKTSMGVLNMVEQFMLLMNQPIPDEIGIPEERKAFRIGLIAEELKELQTACDDNDTVEVADALGDLLYVVLGFALEAGLREAFPAIFAEIHRSNLSKTCATEEDAIKSVEKYTTEGVETFYELNKERYIIYRQTDSKVLKGINYSKPNIQRIIEAYK